MALRRSAARRSMAAADLGWRMEYYYLRFFGDLEHSSRLEMGLLHTFWIWVRSLRVDHGVRRSLTLDDFY